MRSLAHWLKNTDKHIAKRLQFPNLQYIETISKRKILFEINKWVTLGLFLLMNFVGQFSKRELVRRMSICQLVIFSTDVATNSLWDCYDGNFRLICRKQREYRQGRDYSVWATGPEAARAGRPEPL